MSELPMRSVVIIIMFIIVAAVALIFIFSTFGSADMSSSFFNLSKNISENASNIAGQEAKQMPLFS